MKKFLSILLAVMMVLSTVSFAAPSAVGTMDTTEVPVVEVPEVVEETAELDENAELAGYGWDKSGYGKLVYKVDFENDNFDVAGFTTAYYQIKNGTTASYVNPAFDCGNLTTYTNAAGDGFKNAELVTEGGNTYIQGDVNAGYSGFFRLTKYNCAWPEGYYTFAVDVKAPAANAFAKQCNDTQVALTNIHDFSLSEKAQWQSVAYRTTNVVNGADIYGYFVTPANEAAGTVAYDNWEIYYRPATVTLTIAGKEYEVSTDSPVSVATLAANVAAPTGQILAGLSLTEGGELISDQYFFEDATLYPTFKKDPYTNEKYGKALFAIDFESEGGKAWWGNSSETNDSVAYGAQVWGVASYYDARFANGANYRVRLTVNENSHIDQQTIVDPTDSNNHYNYGTAYSQWPQLVLSNWGSVKGEPGIYTITADTMIDTMPSGFATNSGAGWTLVDTFDGALNTWDHLVATKTMTAAGNVPDAANVLYYSLNASDKGVAKVAWDNIIMYYKPFTADVTLIYNGEEYLAEDVSTEGVSADTILAAAGVDVPYGKKAVLSATFGGESVGNVITLVGDATYYVSFVADDSISEYGKRLFLIDFENMKEGDVLKNATDNLTIEHYTDNYNGDWSHLTINWEVGNNVITEEDGNMIIKGSQGWSQIRIGNSKFESSPAGYYTMALKVKNYGSEEKTLSSKDQVGGDTATWVKAGAATGTNGNYLVVNGVWNEVAAELPKATKDFTIYHTAQMTTDVAFDDIALYYRPASVNLTVVNGDEETVYENCNSVVDIDDLLADIEAPFGYKAALSTEKNGEPISGTLNLVSDAKLYVVLVADETIDFTYGKALVIIDFERESMQGWWGCSQEIDNSVDNNGAYVCQSATYFDDRFANDKNFRIRFVINETPRFDQAIVADENGNHYVTGTNGTKWPQVVNTNWGNVQGEPGIYTYMYDAKVEATTETNLAMTHGSFNGGNNTVVDGFSAVVGEWDTVIVQATMDEAGALPKGTWGNFNLTANNTTTISYDNAKIYYKPFTADVDVYANGALVATKEDVSTAGVLASELVAGIKVKGYDITALKLGATTYALEDTVVLPCDCDVELVLVEQPFNFATPTTNDEKSIRTTDPAGIRFKAELTKADMADTTEYGWIVTREELLNNAGIAAEDFTLNSAVNKVSGWNYGNGTSVAKIFEENDEYAWFTAILYFSATDDDGLPSADKLAGKLVARPFVKNDGEYLYGDATSPVSMYDIAYAIWLDDEKWNDLDGDIQTYLEDLMIKVEDAGLGE